MVSTKVVANTIPEIEAKLKSFGGDMVKIEFLDNCSKQMLPNDVARYCHAKLGELYANRLMFGPAAKHTDEAAERATTYKDKITFYLKEITFLVKNGDYLFIDKAFKKALACGNNAEKEQVKAFLKRELLNHAAEFERRGKNSNAVKIYERLVTLPIITEQERKEIITKMGALCSRLGRIRDAVRYENMKDQPPPARFEDEANRPRRVTFEDLGLDEV